MIYNSSPVEAVVIRKVNRFLALVKIDGKVEKAHIPNSGRLKELVAPLAPALLEHVVSESRKTAYTLKAIKYNNLWVCIDSIAPNRLVYETALSGKLPSISGYTDFTREFTLGRHRFDLICEGDGRPPLLVEVKSVTLVRGRTAIFPDAPTIRGRSHLLALAGHVKNGYDAQVLFVIQRSDADRFEPNIDTDPEFCAALREAISAGVRVNAVKLRVGRRSMSIMNEAPVMLSK